MADISTGLSNYVMGTGSLRQALTGKVVDFFGGTIPVASGVYSAADVAEPNTLIVRMTVSGATVKAKQKIRFTPTTAGTTGTWTIVLNGVSFVFTDDASPTEAEVCTGLYRLIRGAVGTASFTATGDGAITAGGKIDSGDFYGLFTLTDNTGTLDIEAATAGVSFDYSASATGAGNSWATAVVTDNAYGLRFNAASGATLEMLTGDTLSGTAVIDGVITHGRIVADNDDNALSTTEIRVQGIAAPANAFFVIPNGTSVKAGTKVECAVIDFTQKSNVADPTT